MRAINKRLCADIASVCFGGLVALLVTLSIWSCTAPASGADPAPAKVVIRMPELTQSQPLPSPDTVAKLNPETLYVIDSDDPAAVVLASPRGVVSITREDGPVKVRGKFADGTGATETRVYKGKAVYFVEAAHTGKVEILVIPSGAKSESDVIRRTLDVTAGEGPRPPPGPPVPDPPKPTPAPVTAEKLYFAIVRDPRDVTPEQARLIGDTPFWNSLKADGHEWDTWTHDSPKAKELGYLDAVANEGVPLPALIILNKEKGERPLAVMKLPKDRAAVTIEVKKYTGAK